MVSDRPPTTAAPVALEMQAARLEGLLAADPGLGRLWRAQAALTEACRSVALEDIAVTEGDVVARPFENRAREAAATAGIAFAADLLRVLARPGSLSDDPAAALGRAWAAAGGGAGQAPDLAALGQGIAAELADPGQGVFGAALRAAARARLATGGARPAFERLVFVQADHAARGGRALRGPDGDGADGGGALAPTLASTLAAAGGAWVLRPSVALTGDGFRPWSPASAPGATALAAGCAADLGRALGLVPRLRAWRAALRALAAGRHGRSRMGDVAAFLEGAPVVTLRSVCEGTGVSERAVAGLLAEVAAAGLVQPVTGRRTARAWAIAPVAALLRQPRPHPRRKAPVPRRQGAGAAADRVRDGAALDLAPPLPPLEPERVASALADLDTALASLDAVLRRGRDGGT